MPFQFFQKDKPSPPDGQPEGQSNDKKQNAAPEKKRKF
jgi:hypothetical protein